VAGGVFLTGKLSSNRLETVESRTGRLPWNIGQQQLDEALQKKSSK